MTKDCKERLLQAIAIGTRSEKRLAEMLFNEEFKFNSIKSLESKSGIASSTIHRFSKKLGYPSFKHFIHDYVELDNVEKIGENSKKGNISLENIELGNQLSDMFNEDIYIVASKRTRGIALILSEQLKLMGVDHHVYDENVHDLVEFVDNVPKEATLLLFTLSGMSNIIFRVLERLAQRRMANKKISKVVLLTASEPLKIFNQYDFFDVVILNGKYNLANWMSYIDAMLDFIKTVLISFHFKKEEAKKK